MLLSRLRLDWSFETEMFVGSFWFESLEQWTVYGGVVRVLSCVYVFVILL